MAREFLDVWEDLVRDLGIDKFERREEFKAELASLIDTHSRLNSEYQNDNSPDYWDRHCGVDRSTQDAWIDTGREFKGLSKLIDDYKKDLDSLIRSHDALFHAISSRSVRLEQCVLNDDSDIRPDLLDSVRAAFSLCESPVSGVQAQEIVRRVYQGDHGIWEALADGLAKMRAIVPLVDHLVDRGAAFYKRAGLSRADSQKNVRLKIAMYDFICLYTKHSKGVIIGRPKDNGKEAHDSLVDLMRLAFPAGLTITSNTVREALRAATEVWHDQKQPQARGEFLRRRNRISDVSLYS